MNEEQRFKDAVMALISAGVHPTPTVIKRLLRQGGAMNSLNGRQCKWLRRDLKVPALRRGYPYYRPCKFNCCKPGGKGYRSG